MIPEHKIKEAEALLARGFSSRFVAARTGVSRTVCGQIQAGKRRSYEEHIRREYEHKQSRDSEAIIRAAREAIVKAGRKSSKSL